MTPEPLALSVEDLEERLEEILEAALSSRRTVTGLAQDWASRPVGQQQTLLHWLPILARINPELAFQCARQLPPFLDRLRDESLRSWLGAIMTRYDQEGLQKSLELLKQGPQRHDRVEGTLFLSDLVGELTVFVTGLGGRRLAIEEGVEPHTNTETLFLPVSLCLGNRTGESHRLYRCLAAHLWGLGRYGTFFPGLMQRLELYPDPDQAARIYLALESHRVDAILTRTFPGLGRFMAQWHDDRNRLPDSWRAPVRALMAPDAQRDLSLDHLAGLYGASCPLPMPLPFHGAALYRPALQEMQRRIEQERILFRKTVGEAIRDSKPVDMPGVGGRDLDLECCLLPDGSTFEMRLDGQPLRLPESLHPVMRSIVQDLGCIPPEYLSAAGSGGYALMESMRQEEDTTEATIRREEADGRVIRYYDEWDCHRNDYRKAWCVLREQPISPTDDPVVASALEKYHGLWQGIRRSFELLRGGDQWLRRQERGDEVDMDALVHSLVDRRTGVEMDSRLFRYRLHKERDVATLILVDMSGSTKGWVNDAIRESLVLLCKALQVLGDRFAVYGFSSMTRKHCDSFVIKSFDQPYHPEVERNIAGICPKDYTRMGVFLRHAAYRLNQQEARIRLLITLSDGKPEDYDSFQDGYRGHYGMEDTRQSLIEARRTGIHPFCITIDTEAREYLPHLYGPARFVVMDDVRTLPLKIADIYRRLTT
ncbi:MAG: nitric oxide reductase activation protein [Magnetococcales bacterium]|nr:nitric oxide reductase activation protein [Magnetococcales bacterium]